MIEDKEAHNAALDLKVRKRIKKAKTKEMLRRALVSVRAESYDGHALDSVDELEALAAAKGAEIDALAGMLCGSHFYGPRRHDLKN